MITEARAGFLVYREEVRGGLAPLHNLKGDILHGENGVAPPQGVARRCLLFALLGDKVKGREAMERARGFLEQQLRENPNDAGHHAQLGLIFAGLERKEDAIREGKRAAELLPESKDAFDGPGVSVSLAQIYAWTGEKDEALQLVEHSLITPAGISVPMLKIDPAWDPLRKIRAFRL